MNTIDLAKHDITVKDGFGFFWASPLSNWHKCQFTVDDIIFTTSEQYMMYHKAILFGDEITAKKILATNDPKKQKALGREVKNFQSDLWEQYRATIVMEGCLEKFLQNKDIQDILLATEDLELVEASPYDKIWGIGLGAEHSDATNKSKWKGLNLLGLILMDVRSFIKATNAHSDE